jgi:hypothetical protein
MFSSGNRIIVAFIACAILLAIVLIGAIDQPSPANTSRIYTQPVHTAAAAANTNIVRLEPMIITAKRLAPTIVAASNKPAPTTLEDTRI